MRHFWQLTTLLRFECLHTVSMLLKRKQGSRVPLRPSDSFNLLIGVAELRATASLSRITSGRIWRRFLNSMRPFRLPFHFVRAESSRNRKSQLSSSFLHGRSTPLIGRSESGDHGVIEVRSPSTRPSVFGVDFSDENNTHDELFSRKPKSSRPSPGNQYTRGSLFVLPEDVHLNSSRLVGSFLHLAQNLAYVVAPTGIEPDFRRVAHWVVTCLEEMHGNRHILDSAMRLMAYLAHWSDFSKKEILEEKKKFARC